MSRTKNPARAALAVLTAAALTLTGAVSAVAADRVENRRIAHAQASTRTASLTRP